MNEPTDGIPTEIKSFFSKEYYLLILAGIVGVLAGAASTVFRWMIDFFARVFSGEGLLMGLSAGIVIILMPFMPMLGGLIIGFARRYFPDAVDENVSTWKLLREMGDPKVRKGLSRMLNMVKALAEQPETNGSS